MPEQIVCANCGIRFSTELAECPWCGTAPRPLAPSVPSAPAAAAPPPASDHGPPPQVASPAPAAEPAPADPAPAPPASAPPPPPAAPPPPATGTAANDPTPGIGQAAPAGLPPSDEPVVVVAAPPAVPPPPPSPEPTLPAALHPDPGPAVAPPANGVTPPPRRRAVRFFGYTAAILVLLIIGALLAEYAPLGPRQRSLTDTVTPVDPLGADQTLVIETTDPPPPTTTEPPDTTEGTVATTTTAAPPTTALALEPIGAAIPLDDLRMGVDGLREALLIGTDGATVTGRLVATFGQPDADTGVVVSDGEFGTCSGDTVRIVRFGSLAVINTVSAAGDETFAAYRLDLDYQEDPSPADDLLTISRLRAGDTVADLQAIYSSLQVLLVDGPDGTSFELRDNDGDLLLHGPTTGVDRGDEIRGIYSPDACA